MKKLGFMAMGMVAITATAEILLPDPSIVRDGDNYYLVGTHYAKSDCGEAVFPVMVSKDLENWKTLKTGYPNGCILPRKEAFDQKWFWAPQLLKHNGKWYFAYTCNHGWGIAVADKVEGPYRAHSVMPKGSGRIDPFILIDDDGTPYAYCSDWNLGGISCVRLKADFSGFDGKPVKCIDNSCEWERKPLEERYVELNRRFNNKDNNMYRASRGVTEGPTVVKRGGKYVLFYSANDYRSPDYCVGVAVADSPTGPWKKLQSGPVLSNNETGLNGTGHGDIFTDGSGVLWYVFHAHNSSIRIHPRRVGIIQLEEKFGDDGYPRYSAVINSMRLL